MNGLDGVSANGWTPLAAMAHQTNWDEDLVTVLKNDQGQGGRSCIISFEGADVLFGDLSNFFLPLLAPTVERRRCKKVRVLHF